MQSKTHASGEKHIEPHVDKKLGDTGRGGCCNTPTSPPGGARGSDTKKELHEPKFGLLKLRNKQQPRRPMEQPNSDRKGNGGKHFNKEERIRLETLIRVLSPGKRKPNFVELAKQLGKHRTSVSREYRRGIVMNKNTQLEEFPVYSAAKGQASADKASLNKGPRGKLTNFIAADICDLILDEKLSPYAALRRLEKEGKHSWLPCERTLYYAIDAGLIGVSREQLPYKPRKKPRKKTGKRMAYNNARGRSINERPPEAEDRSEYGHWEMDTVVGGTGTSPTCLLVMTERKFRRQIIRKIPDRTQDAVSKSLNRLEREPENIFNTMKSLTVDNGCEFLGIDAIQTSALNHHKRRCDLFFAHPYSSYERGSNENANRIIRRFIPKGADISGFTRKQIKDIEDWINALPRKLLDGLSAEEKVKRYFKEAA